MLPRETLVDPQGFVVAGFALPTKNIGCMEKKLVFAALFLLVGFPSFSHAATLVSPYYRGDTFVGSYYRTDVDSNPYNNYGFPGNLNPNTGQITSGNPDTYLSNYYGIKSSGDTNLYKLLNSGGLKTVPLPDPSKKLLKAQEDFQNKLEQERKTIDERLYQLQRQNSTGIFVQCIYPSSSGCTSESQYSSMRASDGATGLLATDVSNNRLSQCRSDIDTYQQKLNQYNQCMSSTQNQALDSIGDKAVELARLEKESAYYKSLLASAMSCKTDHGQFGYYNSEINRCECVTGFGPDANSPYQCIPLNVWCKVESGIGATNRVDAYVDSVNKSVICGCETGYQWDTSTAKCIQTTAPDYASLAAKNGGVSVPVKMTRAEYQAKYGVAPDVVPIAGNSGAMQATRANDLGQSKRVPNVEDPIASTSFRVATSNLLNQAPSTQSTPLQKQSLFEKLKSFFFGWWR